MALLWIRPGSRDRVVPVDDAWQVVGQGARLTIIDRRTHARRSVAITGMTKLAAISLAGDGAYAVCNGAAGSADRFVVAIDLAAGLVRWRHDDPGIVGDLAGAPASSGAPAVTAHGVYYLTEHGDAVGLDRGSGQPRWRWSVGLATELAAESAATERLYVSPYGEGLAAFEPVEVAPPAEDAVISGESLDNCGKPTGTSIDIGGVSIRPDAQGQFDARVRARGLVKLDTASGAPVIVTLTGQHAYTGVRVDSITGPCE